MIPTFFADNVTRTPPGRFSGGACRGWRYGTVHGGCAGKVEKNIACGKVLKIKKFRKVAPDCTGGVW